ncbi:MAG: hypothetical protein AAF654_01115 [Myxococcota bacterium]
MRTSSKRKRTSQSMESVISIRAARARKVQRLKTLVRSGRYEPHLEGIADAFDRRGLLRNPDEIERNLAAVTAELV